MADRAEIGGAMGRGPRLSVVLVSMATLVLAGALVPLTASAATPSTTPVITAPADGATVTTTPLDVTATTVNDGSVAAVQLVLDGRPAYTVDVPVVNGTASGQLPVAGLDGTYSLVAYDCGSVGSECNTNAPATAVSVTVSLPAPTVDAPAAGTVVRSSVDVTAGNLAAPGVQFLVDGTVRATGTSATKSVSLVGLPDGRHQLQVRQCNAAATVCEGALSAGVPIVKDTRGPAWSQVRASPATVYPAKDRYRDTTRLLARVGERARQVRVVLRNGTGRTVRTWSLSAAGPGQVGVTFNGRRSGGALLPNGRYRFTFSGRDAHGRSSTSKAGTVSVSDKRLVATKLTRTVTAQDSAAQVYAGRCSGVYRLSRRAPAPYFKDGVGYYSNSRCRGTRDESLAAVVHGLRLAPAQRYGGLQVSAYGGAASRNGGKAVIAYVTPAARLVSGRVLGRSVGWHAGRRVPVSRVENRAYVFWFVGTIDGHWYNVGSFRVTYTRYVLRSP